MENNYQVLYNKYRPMTFSDVVGQESITKTLQNEIKTNKIAHAYLFVGSRGTGKTTCARILAKAINCEHTDNGDPCNKCESCQSITSQTNMNILEIDAASNNGIDEMRNLQDKIVYSPTSGKYRVVIIDEVHMLSTSAFNALLKILEEPPAHVIFILATTEAKKVLPTIVSRCQRFDFKRISDESIADRIEYVMNQEGKTIERGAAMLIAHLSDGGMRDALSLLDRVHSLDNHITEERTRAVLGLPDNETLKNLSQAISRGNSADIVRIISKLHNTLRLVDVCDQLISFFRDILLIKMRKVEKEPSYFVDEAKNYTTQGVIKIIDALTECYDKMFAGHEIYTFEACLLKLSASFASELDKEINPIIGILESRVKELERQIRELYGAKAESVLSKIAQSTPIASHESTDETKEKPVFKSANEMITYYSDHASVFSDWKVVAQSISAKYADMGKALGNVDAYVSEDYVLIKFDDTVKEYLKVQENKEILKKAIAAVTNRTYKIGPFAPTVPVATDNGVVTVKEVTPKEKPVFKSADEMIAYYSDHASVFSDWKAVTKSIGNKYANMGNALGNVDAYASEDYVLIKFDDTVKKYLKVKENKEILKKAIEEVTNRTYKIGPFAPTVA